MVINVDLDILNSTRQKVDDFLAYEKQETNKTKTTVENIEEYWKGQDYETFKTKWEDITDDSSVYHTTQRAFESFSSYLNKCYTDYKKMQDELKNLSTQINS